LAKKKKKTQYLEPVAEDNNRHKINFPFLNPLTYCHEFMAA
jgi:hypothetical protein